MRTFDEIADCSGCHERAAEIERLRERDKERDQVYGETMARWVGEKRELREEIKRLRDSFWGTDVSQLREEIERLQKELAIIEKPTGILEMQRMLDEANERIEKLEISNDERLKIWNESIYFLTITRDEIDAVWGCTIPRGLSAADQFFADGAREALRIFNIHECEGCGGGGKVKRIPPRYETEQPCPDCAPWGSKGWVIGGEDE